MDIYSKIEKILRAHRQTHNRKTLKSCIKIPHSISKFLCLAIGARPGFLYDYGSLSSECALQIAKDLSTSIESLRDLTVVEFALDQLFILPSQLLHYLSTRQREFIDVGKETPELMSDEPADAAKLTEILSTWNISINRGLTLDLNPEDFKSGPSVFGLLIGYPIIYYIETESNCLSNTMLSVVNCKINFEEDSHLLCSFSCPVYIRDTNSQVAGCIRDWISYATASFSEYGLKVDISESTLSCVSLTL